MACGVVAGGPSVDIDSDDPHHWGLSQWSRTVTGSPRRRRLAGESPEHRLARLAAIEASIFEVIPLRSLDAAIESLPPASTVSVTASPAKGLAATQEIAERLIAGGHRAVPHISARLVRDHTHTRALAAWLRLVGLDEIFLVGGDVTEPGRYHDALSFLGDLLETDHGLRRVGVTAYPDGHPLIEKTVLAEALHGKQTMLAEAGLECYCSTQMCFDAPRIINWLTAERQAGMALPVHLGIAGVVDRARLLSIGVRLGVGQSLRYLRKNRRAVTRLMTAPHYDPNDLLVPLSPKLVDLDIRALHIFTFNQVAATVAWREQNLH